MNHFLPFLVLLPVIRALPTTTEPPPQTAQIPLEELPDIPQIIVQMRRGDSVSFVALRRRHRSSRRVGATSTPQDRRPEPIDAVAGRRHQGGAKGRRVEASGQRGGAGDAGGGTDADTSQPRAAV